MEWNVYYYDINSKQLKTFNVFEHYAFNNEVQQLLKNSYGKDDFSKSLNMTVMYYFWSKAEWEIEIVPWLDNTKVGIKIDVYDQITNNWEHFVDYIWNYKENKHES